MTGIEIPDSIDHVLYLIYIKDVGPLSVKQQEEVHRQILTITAEEVPKTKHEVDEGEHAGLPLVEEKEVEVSDGSSLNLLVLKEVVDGHDMRILVF